MPVIDVAKWDLERLTGLKIDEALKYIEYVKCEIEEDLGDRLKLEVTHDRPDHFSAEGLARTIKGVAELELGLPKIKIEKSSIRLHADYIEERPYISMAVVRDVKIDDEAIKQIIQLQEKLHETYGRGRRKIAIGFYDVSKIRPPIYYRRVSQDDTYVPLGFDKPIPIREMYEVTEQGRKYSGLIKREAPPALIDSSGQLMVVIPVLGSECCKITEGTRDVLIDVTGTELKAVKDALSVLIYSLLERSSSRTVDIVEGGNAYVHEYLKFRVSREDVERHLGITLTDEEFLRHLGRARLEYSGGEVVAPPYRTNMLSWVDVAEDIAIVVGYNSFPRETPKVLTSGRRHRIEVIAQEARKVMLAMGFAEVNDYILTGSIPMCKSPQVLNPVSELYTAARCTIITQLIASAALMRRREIRLFEVGDVVKDGGSRKALAFLISRDGITLTDGLAALKALAHLLGLKISLKPADADWLLSGRAAEIRGDVNGVVGEVNPEVLISLGHQMPTVVAEIYLE